MRPVRCLLLPLPSCGNFCGVLTQPNVRTSEGPGLFTIELNERVYTIKARSHDEAAFWVDVSGFFPLPWVPRSWWWRSRLWWGVVGAAVAAGGRRRDAEIARREPRARHLSRVRGRPRVAEPLHWRINSLVHDDDPVDDGGQARGGEAGDRLDARRRCEGRCVCGVLHDPVAALADCVVRGGFESDRPSRGAR